MNESQSSPSTARIALKFGIISGVVSVFFLLVIYLTGYWKNPWISSTAIIISLIFYYLAFKEFRTENSGYLSIGEAIGIGMLLSVISTIIGQLFDFIYKKFIDPEFVQKTLDFQEEQMLELGLPQSAIDQGLERAQDWANSGLNVVIAIIVSVVVGLIISLIMGAIMQKKRPVFD